MKTQEQLDKQIPGRALTAVCFFIGFIHFIKSQGTPDWVLLGLIVLAASPWMGYVFKGFSKDGVQYHDDVKEGKPVTPSEQKKEPSRITVGENQKTPPAVPTDPSTLKTYPYSAQKILATLWKYQKIKFPNNNEHRFTFSLDPKSPEYDKYLRGMCRLMQAELIDLVAKGFLYLTDNGFNFCEQNDIELTKWRETYDRFSN